MQTIEAHRADHPFKNLLKTGVPAGAWEPNVRAPALVVDAETGDPVTLVTRYPGNLSKLRAAIRSYPMSTTLRATGTRNVSSSFGFISGREVMRRYSCRVCSMAAQAPKQHAVLMETGRDLAYHLRSVIPEKATRDAEIATAIDPDWLIPGTPWTSGVVNETSPLPYHMDANNMPTWNAMVVIRRGIEGGHLHVPEWGLVLDCRDGDVCYFPAFNTIHGVTPMRKKTADAYRYSAVWYTVSAMRNCLPVEADLALGRRKRTEAEDHLRERQQAAGLINAD